MNTRLASTGQTGGRPAAVSPAASLSAMALPCRASRSQQSLFEIGLKLQRQETVLGEEMPGALAPLGHVRCIALIEEHHRLGGHRAALGRAERENIDASFPRHLGGARVGAHERVGEARAVHMHLHAVRMGDLRQRRDLVRPVDRSGFARLRERDRRRNNLMRRVADVVRNLSLSASGVSLQPTPGMPTSFSPPPKNSGAPHSSVKMCAFVMREHRAPRRADMGERQRVCRGAGRHQKHRNVTLEDFADAALDRTRQVVVAVTQREAVVADTSACMISGATPAVLSLAKFMRSFHRSIAQCLRHVGANAAPIHPEKHAASAADAVRRDRARGPASARSRNREGAAPAIRPTTHRPA